MTSGNASTTDIQKPRAIAPRPSVNGVSMSSRSTSSTTSTSSEALEQPSETRKTHSCEHCDYTTQRKGDMTKHIRIHSGYKPFQCGKCEWSFKQSSHLRMHVLRKHSTVENPFKCHLCGVCFRTFTLLLKHKRAKHKASYEDQVSRHAYAAGALDAVGVAAILNQMPLYAMQSLKSSQNDSNSNGTSVEN